MYFIYDSINNYTKNNYKNNIDLLTDNDKKKLNNLVKEQDKELLILSRYLLNKLLINNYNISYKDLNIYHNKDLKPLSDKIYFNISHKNIYTAVCISKNKIGIDIEEIKEVDLNITNQFCTPKEKQYINNSKDKYKSLFTIFSLKEAYFKMLGTNLNNIKNIEFNIHNNKITCNSKLNLDIKLIYNINNYVIAIIEKKD